MQAYLFSTKRPLYPPQVRADSLPPQVSPETAHSILFIGKAVRVLRPREGSVMQDQLAAGAPLEALQASPVFDAPLFESAIGDIRERVHFLHPFFYSFQIMMLHVVHFSSVPSSNLQEPFRPC